jgi:predicted esterase
MKFGLPVKEARAAMVLIHGRGASPEDILSLVPEFDQSGFTYLAPQAAGFTWYPYPFLQPLEVNEPGLSSALAVIDGLLEGLAESGIPAEKTILLGFSQGACLVMEYAVRNARRYGGVVVLSGGLIGPPGTSWSYPGSLDGTPVFLGCSDVDPHIPKERVLETAQVMQQIDGKVTLRLYPGMGHLVNEDEIEAVREQMRSLLAGG